MNGVGRGCPFEWKEIANFVNSDLMSQGGILKMNTKRDNDDTRPKNGLIFLQK